MSTFLDDFEDEYFESDGVESDQKDISASFSSVDGCVKYIGDVEIGNTLGIL